MRESRSFLIMGVKGGLSAEAAFLRRDLNSVVERTHLEKWQRQDVPGRRPLAPRPNEPSVWVGQQGPVAEQA